MVSIEISLTFQFIGTYVQLIFPLILEEIYWQDDKKGIQLKSIYVQLFFLL